MTNKNVSGFKSNTVSPSNFNMEQRRGKFYDIEQLLAQNDFNVDEKLMSALTRADLIYRSLCGILYNYVPMSGHPGGSISSGRIVQSLLFHTMDYDISNPDAPDADHLAYAAGHKAMGLYAGWALRNEYVRVSNPKLLPEEKYQLRLEDLLGFRRNPTTTTPLFNKYHAKPLDGHPSPVVPFVRLATGASGVGVTTAVGLAFGALDTYGKDAPWIHILEGEGGMTPGRVHEAMGTAGSNQLKNIVMHLDWNQASIDSNAVCREGSTPGDYVQWNPMELAYLNDWNVIFVKNGFDFKHILAAQDVATHLIDNNQPTAIVYRTVKGWKYGIEGKGSHGAGHKFCSDEFYQFLWEFEKEFQIRLPQFDSKRTDESIEALFYDNLMSIRNTLENNKDITDSLTSEIEQSNERLKNKKREARKDSPTLSVLYEDNAINAEKTPPEVALKPGDSATHRGILGTCLNYLNHKTGGAFVGSAADLFGSTSLSNIGKGFPEGYFNFEKNPGSRLVMIGGICEDAIGGFMAGLATYGGHVGVGSSYGAFIAALQHIPARLHAIGQEARVHTFGDKRNPFIIICGHAGPKTGEDGPTHADPQALQLVQENFPKDSLITLTPWDTQEMWPLIVTALRKRPAVIVPFVTRPNETVLDRAQYKLAPVNETIQGVYALRKADPKAKKYHGTVVLQGNGVAGEFVTHCLPKLDADGMNMNVYYVSSAELFDYLSEDEKEKIFPESHAKEAMGITEFTVATMYRWITSNEGRKRTLHPFGKGHFLGSGQADKVFREAGLNGPEQLKAVMNYAKFIEKL